MRSVDFARANGARIINASLGGPHGGQDTLFYDALKRFQDAGGIILAAAGNAALNHDSGVASDHMYPSDYGVTTTQGGVTFQALTGVISVAAMDNTDALASFSDYGATSVHVGAPGVSILSTSYTSTSSILDDFSGQPTGGLSSFTPGGLTANNW